MDEAALAVAVAGLQAEGGEALACQASVTDADAVERAFAQVEQAWGRIDVLVNNAGISANKPTLEVSAEEWRRAVDINLTGVFLCAQAAGRRMVPAGAGCIINLASMYGVVAAPDRAAYCATKGAVVLLTETLAVEWGPLGVRVNALAPGYVETDLVRDLAARGPPRSRTAEAAHAAAAPGAAGRNGRPGGVPGLAPSRLHHRTHPGGRRRLEPLQLPLTRIKPDISGDSLMATHHPLAPQAPWRQLTVDARTGNRPIRRCCPTC